MIEIRWADVPEAEKWKITWGVFWRTVIVQLAIAAIIVIGTP
jgi:hypothetical protein